MKEEGEKQPVTCSDKNCPNRVMSLYTLYNNTVAVNLREVTM